MADMSEEPAPRHRYVITLSGVSSETFADVYTGLCLIVPPLTVTRRHDDSGNPADLVVSSAEPARRTIEAVLQLFPVEYSLDELAL
jgi:hypothetical protein